MILALLCATLFTIDKSALAKAAMDKCVRIKKLTAVACSAAGATTNNNPWTDDKNSGNGCSHQQGAGAACDINSLKRRLLKVLNC